ncbi:RNA polymerase sigma factor [Methylopila turkensis]|uniref:DNA-directed RNA polymerase sigma-70 factor n=1 Tax=Methylopila turkensis TaxID=1437816 RepID=A0A9W6JNT2_9HYPH|nr:RNA polymerase sigma factor [Methylopila turkensis]GLK79746.1 DNA-directed RNA polymerase sigma-70 factor [Methylopila turkensis]
MTSPPFAEELVALLPRLRRFARSLCGDAALADDLVQLACERALKARDLYEPGTRLDAWTFRILRNVWLDGIRKRRSEGATEPIDDAFDLAGEDGRHVAHASLAAGAVAEAMGRLADEHRRVLTLVCVEEMSYREAAEAIGAPIGTVMSRLSRARLALARQLGLADGETLLE